MKRVQHTVWTFALRGHWNVRLFARLGHTSFTVQRKQLTEPTSSRFEASILPLVDILGPWAGKQYAVGYCSTMLLPAQVALRSLHRSPGLASLKPARTDAIGATLSALLSMCRT